MNTTEMVDVVPFARSRLLARIGTVASGLVAIALLRSMKASPARADSCSTICGLPCCSGCSGGWCSGCTPWDEGCTGPGNCWLVCYGSIWYTCCDFKVGQTECTCVGTDFFSC